MKATLKLKDTRYLNKPRMLYINLNETSLKTINRIKTNSLSHQPFKMMCKIIVVI